MGRFQQHLIKSGWLASLKRAEATSVVHIFSRAPRAKLFFLPYSTSLLPPASSSQLCNGEPFRIFIMFPWPTDATFLSSFLSKSGPKKGKIIMPSLLSLSPFLMAINPNIAPRPQPKEKEEAQSGCSCYSVFLFVASADFWPFAV